MTTALTRKSYAIINSRSPFDISHGKEALDAALILGSYEQPVALFFIDDGVYHTQQGQKPQTLGAKDYLATYQALGFYDIEQLYVCRESLAARKLSTNLNLADAQLLSSAEIGEKLQQFDICLRF
jgi:tRNA 2-thiouridine synthesizing protein C